ncbi:DUF6273 domain-containing protein [Eubacteriaceae bacterium ES3]|nr:DUF6273 domain-containing protein [Eubacteriaceae bacterium ES3]
MKKNKRANNADRTYFKKIILLLTICMFNGFILLAQSVFCADAEVESRQNVNGDVISTLATDATSNNGLIIPDAVISLDDYLTGKRTSSLYLGQYEQDNNPDSIEGILWQVLENDEGILFLLADRNIDTIQYHQKYENITWAESSLREWLNSDFYENAFSKAERTLVKLTKLPNDSNTAYGTTGGLDTEDYFFLLSIADVYNQDYGFSDSASRMVINTHYTGSRGATGKELGDGFWWLRSPGRSNRDALVVYFDGFTTNYGYNVDFVGIGLRPACNFDTANIMMLRNSKISQSDAVGSQLFEIINSENNQNENETVAYVPTIWNEQMLLTIDKTDAIFLNSHVSEPERSYTYNYDAVIESNIDNTYISAVIEDGNTHHTLYYAKLKSIAQKEDLTGQVTLTLPEELEKGGYVLRLFLETCNEKNRVDFASEFVTIPVSVETNENIISLDNFEQSERSTEENSLTAWDKRLITRFLMVTVVICAVLVAMFLWWIKKRRKAKIKRL